jgi:hypothetical protein
MTLMIQQGERDESSVAVKKKVVHIRSKKGEQGGIQQRSCGTKIQKKTRLAQNLVLSTFSSHFSPLLFRSKLVAEAAAADTAVRNLLLGERVGHAVLALNSREDKSDIKEIASKACAAHRGSRSEPSLNSAESQCLAIRNQIKDEGCPSHRD